MRTFIRWMVILLLVLPSYGYAQETWRDTLFVHNAVLSGLTGTNGIDSMVVIENGNLLKQAVPGEGIDTFFIQYTCIKGTPPNAWIFSGDTVYIDTCLVDSTATSVMWVRGGTNIYSTNTNDNIFLRGTNKVRFTTDDNYIHEDGSGVYGVIINGKSGVTLSYNGTKYVIAKASAFRPVTDSALDLGTSSYEWRAGYFDGIVYTDGLQVQDGTQGAGKVLVSDASGNASWGIGADSSKWAKTGNYVYPKNLTDSIGIGTATPTAGFNVIDDNPILYISGSDTAYTYTDMLVGSNDFGYNYKRWITDEGYGGTRQYLTGDFASILSESDITTYVDNKLVFQVGETKTTIIDENNGLTYINLDPNVAIYHEIPNTYDIGTATKAWRHGYFSGTLISDSVRTGDGTNDVRISSDGITLHGTATVYDDLRIDVNGVKLPGVNPPTWTAFKGSELLGFSSQSVEGNEELCYFTVQFPHARKDGSNVSAHVHWTHSTAGATDSVKWELTYSWTNIGDTFPTESTTVISELVGSTTSKHHMATFPVISGASKTLSSMMVCRLRRKSSHASDTYSGSALLLEIDIHYEIDALGSREYTTK